MGHLVSDQCPVTSDSPPLLQELVTPLLCADGDVSSVQFCNIDIELWIVKACPSATGPHKHQGVF